jgi:hypothetical protein
VRGFRIRRPASKPETEHGRQGVRLVSVVVLMGSMLGCLEGDAALESSLPYPDWDLPPSAGPSRESNDGVPILTISDAPVRVLGPEDPEGMWYFGQIAGALFLTDGSVAAVDRQQSRVWMFGVDGRLVATPGSRGVGPGEFRVIREVVRGTDGSVGVWDSQLQRITWVGRGSEMSPVLQHVRVPPDGRVGLRFVAGGPGLDPIFARVVPARPSEVLRSEVRVPTIQLLRPDTTGLLRAVGPEFRGRPALARLVEGGGVSSHPVRYTAAPSFAGGGPGLVVLDPMSGDVRVLPLGEGEPMNRTLEGVGRVLSGQEHAAEVERLVEIAGGRLDPALISASVPERAAAFDALRVDANGRMWVRETPEPDRNGTESWVVFQASSGDTLFRTHLPSNLIFLDASDGLVMGLRRDALGLDRLEFHRLVPYADIGR